MRALILLAMLTPAAATAQVPEGWADFDRRFREYVEEDDVVGASVAFVRDGRVLARSDIGLADRAADRAVDNHTIFHWGSITKTLTAVAIMQLRDRGLLSLDDRVVRYIPELRQVHDPYGKLDSITVRMLLSHSAGFMNPTWPYDEGHDWEPFEPTTWQQLVAMMPYQRLEFEPGTRYGYSNPAFIYLARIIEQLTGDPWESYVRKNIFMPLGLDHSYFRTTPYHLSAHRSHNYSVRADSGASGGAIVTDHGADFDPGITTPNGGWNAPVSDLVRWVAFLTDAGERENYDVVLPRTSLAEMWEPVVPMAEGYEASPDRFMGLSFFLVGPEEEQVIGHTGSQANFRAFLYFNPRTQSAVIAAFNTTNYASPVDRAGPLREAAIGLLR